MGTHNSNKGGPSGGKPVPEPDDAHTDGLDSTDRLRIVAQSEDAFAVIDHDDRGRARLKWIADLAPRSSDDTFDELKALANDSLSLAEPEPRAAERPPAKHDVAGGYDPYDVTPPAANTKPKTKK